MNPNDDTPRGDPLAAERRRMAAAYDAVLHEPVPDRLMALLAAPAPAPAAAAPVIDLGAVRAHRRAMSSWAAWGGMAASLVLGTLIGTRLPGLPGLPGPAGTAGLETALAEQGGQWVATGAIAQALGQQLAGDAPSGAVAVQLSFVDRGGQFCRTFSSARVAGLACRGNAGRWAVQELASLPATTAGGMRQAASSLPPAVLAAVDARLQGEALNAAQERAARDAGWQR